MSLYLQAEGIKGSVIAKGYEGWTELLSSEFGLTKSINTPVGRTNDRQIGMPRFQQVEVTKLMDKSSPYFFERAFNSEVIKKVLIHDCRGRDSISAYVEYTLSNVLISHYANASHTQTSTCESFCLNYTKIEMKVKEKSPIVTGYNLETASLI